MPTSLLVRLLYMSTLAERIKEAMAESGAIAADLARACGIKPPSVSAWLSGETKTLKAATAMRAAEFLGVNQLWLTEGKGPKRGHDNRSSSSVSSASALSHSRADQTILDPGMGSGAMLRAAADALLPSPNGESREHPAQSPGNNKGMAMRSNVVRLHQEEVGVEDGYVRMELLSPTPSAGRGRLVSEAPYVVRHLDVLESWARTTLGCADPSRVKLLTCVGDSMEGTIKDRDVVFVDLAQSHFSHPGIYVLSVGDALLIKRLDMTVTGDLEVISDNREKYSPQRVHASDLDQVTIAGKVVGWWTLRTS